MAAFKFKRYRKFKLRLFSIFSFKASKFNRRSTFNFDFVCCDRQRLSGK